MRLFTTTTVISLFATLAFALTFPKRQTTTIWQSPFSGTIVAPAANDVIVPGANFTFEYDNSNWCESGFSPFTVYLTDGAVPPAFENVTVNGTLAEGAYILGMGKYVIANFPGLPSVGTPPPNSMVLPATIMSEVDNTTQVYLTVLQEFDGCPGHIAVEYSVTSVPVTLRVAAA
ncbi:hypothetical protein LXA43DRAFT_890939 [Ganoderma leucocontextum]|nr:hypothetical protein LXA43DRAFT_890939 [Ganoderma leucocontextum]